MLRPRTRLLLVMAGIAAGAALTYWPIALDRVLAGRDIFRLFIPDAAFLAECLSLREWPLWNPYQRLGQPFAATLYSQAFYPPRVLLVLLANPATAISLEQLFHALVAAGGMYFLCRTLGRSAPASFAAGALLGFGETLTQLAIQQNVVDAVAWTGLMLGAATRLANAPKRQDIALLALATGLSLLAGSPEMTVWQLLLVGAILLLPFRGQTQPWRRSLRGAGVAAVAGLWGLALAGAQAVPALELTRHSMRTLDLDGRFEWSMPWVGLVALGWPNADQPRETYWGSEQNFVPTVFVGSLALAFAFAAAVLARRNRRAWPYLGGALLFALLALGSHFPPATWVLRLPPLSLFRYPSKYIVGCIFCLCVLAAFGLDRVSAAAARVDPSRRLLKWAALGFALLLLGALVILVGVPLRTGAAAGILWPTTFLTAATALFFAVRRPAVLKAEVRDGLWVEPPPARGPGRARAARLRASWLVLFAVELFSTRRFFNDSMWQERKPLMGPSALAAAIPRPFEGRLSVNLSQDDEYLTQDPGEYVRLSRDALVPLRFVEERLPAVEGYGAPEPLKISRALDKESRAFLDFAGAQYYVRRFKTPYPDLEPLPRPNLALPRLFRSSTAQPRAYVVHEATHGDAKQAYEWLVSPAQAFRRQVFLEAPVTLPPASCTTSQAKVAHSSPMRVEVLVDACAEGYAVLTDTHFPGWEAQLDGAPVEILRANYLARAVRVPVGHHRLTFHYRPGSFRLGGAASLAALLALLIAFALPGRRRENAGPLERTGV